MKGLEHLEKASKITDDMGGGQAMALYERKKLLYIPKINTTVIEARMI